MMDLDLMFMAMCIMLELIKRLKQGYDSRITLSSFTTVRNRVRT